MDKSYKQLIVECIIGGMIGTIISFMINATVKFVEERIKSN